MPLDKQLNVARAKREERLALIKKLNAQIEEAFGKRDNAASELSALDDDIHAMEEQLKEAHEGDLIEQLVQASKTGRM